MAESGRLVQTIGGRWEIGSTNRLQMRGCPKKQVGNGRLRPMSDSFWWWNIIFFSRVAKARHECRMIIGC